MTAAKNPSPDSRTASRVSLASAGAVAAIAALVLLGWAFDIFVLRSVLPGFVAMNPTTAMCFLLGAFSVAAAALAVGRFPARVAGALVAGVGASKLAGLWGGFDAGVDRWLFSGKLAAVAAAHRPNWMAPNTAAAFVLTGIALLLLHSRKRVAVAHCLALAVSLVALLALVGYAYSLDALYHFSTYVPMALLAAVNFLLLSIAMFAARPREGFVRVITGPGAAGATARRLLPAAVLVPVVLGWLRLMGQRREIYSVEFGVSLMVAASALFFSFLIWWNARLIERSESGRERAEAEVDQFFDLSLDLMCIAGFDGYFKRLNPAWEAALGFSRDELTARPFLEFIHPADRTATVAEAERLSRGLATVSFSNRYRCADGSYKWLLWNARADPKHHRIYAAARDVTADREAQQKLRRSEERFRLLVSTVKDYAILSLDPDGRVVSWNQGAEGIKGYRPEEIVGQHFSRFYPPEDVADGKPERQLRIAAAEGRVEDEGWRVRRDGSRFLADVVITALRDSDGTLRGFGKVTRDITERKRAEDEIRALNQELGKTVTELKVTNQELEAFSYSVSHDLRAPLRHVVGFAQLLEKHAGRALDEKGGRYLRTISDSARRMGDLIDDLLAFSRTGRASLHRARVDLRALCQDVRRELCEDVDERRIQWEVDGLPVADADPAMLRQVFVNLLSNAVKYTAGRDPAKIEIGAFERPGEHVIFVRDNGVGFDMQYADRLFGVFQRLHRSEEFEGTGIGLANVRRIVHRHGGRTWAEGLVDAGATFFFSLPTEGPK